MNDFISRQAAIEALEREKTYCSAFRDGYAKTDIFEKYNMGINDGIKALNNLPTIDHVRHGKWTEKKVTHEDNRRSTIIADWQSAKCSNCGKYHTTPYLYYFDHYNYCPNCGAKMEIE